MELYSPIKIRDAYSYASRILKNSRDPYTLEDDSLFEALIRKISKMQVDKVLGFCSNLDAEVISRIAAYVCINKYKVERSNLFIALNEYASLDDWLYTFRIWQNHYEDVETQINLSIVLFLDKFTDELSGKMDIQKIDWLKEQDYLLYLLTKGKEYATEDAYKDFLNSVYVESGTKLYNYCVGSYICYCSRLAYLSLGPGRIIDNLRASAFKADRTADFVCNFVTQLSLNELKKMTSVYKFLILNPLYEEKLRETNAWNVYSVWKGFCTLDVGFDGDKYRRDFWFRYFRNDNLDQNSFAMWLDFEGYRVIEFKGKAAGPAYLIYKGNSEEEKKAFKRIMFGVRNKSKADLSNYLYQLHENRNTFNRLRMEESHLVVGRQTHAGGYNNWWWDFDYMLKQHNIYPN